MSIPAEFQLNTLKHDTCPLCSGSVNETNNGWLCQDPRCATEFDEAVLKVAAFGPRVDDYRTYHHNIGEEIGVEEVRETFDKMSAAALKLRTKEPTSVLRFHTKESTLGARMPEAEATGMLNAYSIWSDFSANVPNVQGPAHRSIDIGGIITTTIMHAEGRTIVPEDMSRVIDLVGVKKHFLMRDHPIGSYSIGIVSASRAGIYVTPRHYDMSYTSAIAALHEIVKNRIALRPPFSRQAISAVHGPDDRLDVSSEEAEHIITHGFGYRGLSVLELSGLESDWKEIEAVPTETLTVCGTCATCKLAPNEPPYCKDSGAEVSLDQPGCYTHVPLSTKLVCVNGAQLSIDDIYTHPYHQRYLLRLTNPLTVVPIGNFVLSGYPEGAFSVGYYSANGRNIIVPKDRHGLTETQALSFLK